MHTHQGITLKGLTRSHIAEAEAAIQHAGLTGPGIRFNRTTIDIAGQFVQPFADAIGNHKAAIYNDRARHNILATLCRRLEQHSVRVPGR